MTRDAEPSLSTSWPFWGQVHFFVLKKNMCIVSQSLETKQGWRMSHHLQGNRKGSWDQRGLWLELNQGWLQCWRRCNLVYISGDFFVSKELEWCVEAIQASGNPITRLCHFPLWAFACALPLESPRQSSPASPGPGEIPGRAKCTPGPPWEPKILPVFDSFLSSVILNVCYLVGVFMLC